MIRWLPSLSPRAVARVGVALTMTAVSLATAGLSACASGGATAGASRGSSYGYMVPGPALASAIGLGATDTLPELPAMATLPATLAHAIAQEVLQGPWNNRCTRQFGGASVYALIFYRACDASLGPESDPVVIVGFSADGRAIGRMRWSGPSTVRLLVPARRF